MKLRHINKSPVCTARNITAAITETLSTTLLLKPSMFTGTMLILFLKYKINILLLLFQCVKLNLNSATFSLKQNKTLRGNTYAPYGRK
jgi:hypothetical protein